MSQLRSLSRDQLLVRLHELVERDHIAEGELVAHLGEVDARRLYLAQACPSMFHYCVHLLHFAEGVAYKRIAVARASRRFPEILVALRGGDLHLAAASLIAPHLDRAGVAEWVAAARHKTAREIKAWIADRKPKANVTTSMRRAVWTRDGGSCTDVSREGRQCGSRDFLEFHHQLPWARCREHELGDIHLRCRAHNQFAAELDFGVLQMARFGGCQTGPEEDR